MTDIGHSPAVRDRRKSTRVAGAIVLVVVAIALAAAGRAIGTAAFLWAALACLVVAAILWWTGRRVRRHPPSHADHPHLDHPEDDHP